MLLKSSQSNIAGSLWVSKCGKGKCTHVYIMYISYFPSNA